MDASVCMFLSQFAVHGARRGTRVGRPLCLMGLVAHASPLLRQFTSFRAIALSVRLKSPSKLELLRHSLALLQVSINISVPLSLHHVWLYSFRKTSSLVQNPSTCYVCIEETLVPFRGRIVMRQYNKSKSHHYGLKLFKLCSGNGYTHKFLLYSGKNNFSWKPDDVVLKLMDGYLERGQILTADNYYTFLPLVSEFLKQKTYLVGK